MSYIEKVNVIFIGLKDLEKDIQFKLDEVNPNPNNYIDVTIDICTEGASINIDQWNGSKHEIENMDNEDIVGDKHIEIIGSCGIDVYKFRVSNT